LTNLPDALEQTLLAHAYQLPGATRRRRAIESVMRRLLVARVKSNGVCPSGPSECIRLFDACCLQLIEANKQGKDDIINLFTEGTAEEEKQYDRLYKHERYVQAMHDFGISLVHGNEQTSADPLRILVVEDEFGTFSHATSRTLRRNGHSVWVIPPSVITDAGQPVFEANPWHRNERIADCVNWMKKSDARPFDLIVVCCLPATKLMRACFRLNIVKITCLRVAQYKRKSGTWDRLNLPALTGHRLHTVSAWEDARPAPDYPEPIAAEHTQAHYNYEHEVPAWRLAYAVAREWAPPVTGLVVSAVAKYAPVKRPLLERFQEYAQELLLRNPTEKDRRTVPTAHRLLFGYSARPKCASHSVGSPYLPDTVGLCDGRAKWAKYEAHDFKGLCVELLRATDKEYAALWRDGGAVVLHFESAISRSSGHTDKQDPSYQYTTSWGENKSGVMVNERAAGGMKKQIATHNVLAKFDGRFPHWNCKPSTGRYSAVFYLVSAPTTPRFRATKDITASKSRKRKVVE
jgi:hypothetical protein